MDSRDAKSRLRRDTLARLQRMDADRRASESASLRRLLDPLLQGASLNVALYASLPHEVDLPPLLRERPQHRYAFPRCLPVRKLSFHCVADPVRELLPGAHGIAAPAEGLPELAPEDIDLLIVPGVAFTEAGDRLGYGGGYYDRFIPRCRRARVLALAFAEQLVDALPTEPHDVRLPQILHL